MTTNLRIDPGRTHLRDATGIYIRAVDDSGKWQSADLAQLDRMSVLAWLKQLSPESVQDVVGILLNHGHLNPRA